MSSLAQRPLIECAVTEGSSELLVHQFQKVALIYLFDFSVISDSEIDAANRKVLEELDPSFRFQIESYTLL